MGSYELYEPVSLACVLPEIFPRVALYTKTDGKHVLYKEESLPFTEIDRDRLLNSKTLTLFVRTGDFEEVSRFTEENLSEILNRCDMDQAAKCAALTQATTTYLKNIFADPEKAQDAERCRNLSGHLAQYISESQSISDLIQTMGEASPFAIKHSMQVAVMSMLVWSKLFPEKNDALVDIGIAGMLHDIGMSLILKNILEETDYWTSPNMDEIKRHPFEGYVFLRKNGHYNELVLDAVRHHHERYFGGGYPGGLKGDEIKIPTQVVGLTDMYCTLIADRPTRKASTPEEAFKIIGDETHKCFSTILFYAFQSAIKQ
jgi:HD-GYP domain-containing protein (c-di-GMP phosphodiesterase class II)